MLAGGAPGTLAGFQKDRSTTVRSAGVGKRRAGREDSVPFREGRQVRGARAAAPPGGTAALEAAPGEGPTPRPGGGNLVAAASGGARGGPCRWPSLWLLQARRGRLGVGGGPAPGPAAGRGRRGHRALTTAGRQRETPVTGRGRQLAGGGLAARGGPGAAGAAGEGALALPRRPLLSVCVCSKMAARLAPRDTDAGPPLRHRRCRHRLPPSLPPTPAGPDPRDLLALLEPHRRGLDARRPQRPHPRHVT